MTLGRVLPSLLLGLELFAVSAAPSLLWGDDAELQRIAITGETRAIGQSSAASHLLWQVIASAFVRWTTWLPIDAAGRVTLVSAVAASAATVPVALTIRDVGRLAGLSPWGQVIGSAIGTVAFSLGHTFWLLASRPDAYTIQTALLALATWFAVRAVGSPAPWLWWPAIAAVVVITVTNHAMVLASAPGLALLAVGGVRGRKQLIGFGGIAFAIGSASLVVAWLVGFPIGALVTTLGRYRPQLPRPSDPVAWLAFLVYQFPISLAFAWWGIKYLSHRVLIVFISFLLLYIGTVFLVMFPALYIRDQYIFYLPSYVPVAVVIGIGAGWVVENPPRWVRVRGRWLALSLVAMACAPVVVYPLAAAVAGPIATRLAPARALPGRDPVWYYLWPPKTGYTGARDYVTAAFGALPRGAVVVADWLPYQPMRYVQAVEGGRPDVRLEMINAGDGRQLTFLKAQSPGTPLFLADVSPPPYYEIDDIRACFDVEAVGVVYRLQRRVEC
jgi:hypothetical protein